ncbi:MerR family DNA-binding transcriptional regulator [Oceanobacillus sojae]|uniref:MerR family DNA-binding transcriptional regulator n=1 Tax=Oceanobacillus sojae TaxID=582851 RepID=UPI0036D2643D
MLTIKKASEKVEVPVSTIRYYDNEGLLPFIKRDENGYRMFRGRFILAGINRLYACNRNVYRNIKACGTTSYEGR